GRRGRRGYAEAAEGIPKGILKVFGKSQKALVFPVADKTAIARHSRAEPAPAKAWGGNPRLRFLLQWIPACAGMTTFEACLL
ncbi:MAG: hypothetical protein KA084_00020, partial [Brachymonas sp.]|nr:hypothetical protein [Brachymonas sp.]MBP7733765.1 hypothetical protein [Brachymonas sp.]MBP7744475.1 hypothetical protein [Brachymonas sp.]